MCAAQEAKSKSLSAQELLGLLRSDISMDDVPQSGAISDAMLDQVLDRSWMVEPDEQAKAVEAAGVPDKAAGDAQKQKQQASNARQRTRRALPAPAAADAAAAGAGSSAGTGRSVQGGLPYPPQGVGYEVVQAMEDSGLLETVS
jgi:hypothetical protein